ncbi:histone-lysine N-methyltransferase PRDM9-like isoform X2 [Cyprinus carpio]|uniref:Histone-lysine N-methyltransferase PRDM9-like isoform X2 n=1 Tax=Cyprinus carpio TaxID=7962 RepID=A0A9Q9VCK4_CYPCA|nr:histone-lysine N-methyltransferase PRDM9-like isoform X2 [Cyprinus carpio]
MSCGAAVQKQVLLIMDGLVTSIVAEICQLDIFQSERRNGNLDTDIKMNLTAAVRKIANSTAEHICRVLHKASSGSRKDLTRPDQVNHTVEQQFAGSGRSLNTHIKDEEHVKGGDRQDFTSDVVSGIQERLNCTLSGGHLLQTVEEELEFRFEEVFVHEEEQVECQSAAVDDTMEPNADESESVEHQREEQWTTEPNSNDISVQLNTLAPPDIIEMGLDVPTDAAETEAVDESMEPNADESESVEYQREEQWTTEPNSNDISVQLNTLDAPDIIETGLDVPIDAAEEVQPNASDEQNICKICGKTFTHLNNLRRHEQKLHSGETPHACQECGERFGSRRLLQIHRREHKVEKPHKCTLCDKLFRLPNHLRNHMMSHDDQRPFSCATCGKSFALISVLRAHERTHAGEKTFVCLQCGSKFLTKSYLDYHQRVHTGEKPYLCTLWEELCPKGQPQGTRKASHANSPSDAKTVEKPSYTPTPSNPTSSSTRESKLSAVSFVGRAFGEERISRLIY